jgi:hypothetical protein
MKQRTLCGDLREIAKPLRIFSGFACRDDGGDVVDSVCDFSDDDGGDGGSGGGSLRDGLVDSIRKCFLAPLVRPGIRGRFGADHRGLVQVIRECANSCLSFVNGNSECVALAGWEVISFSVLEIGDLVQQLYDAGVGRIKCLAVAGEGCGGEPRRGRRYLSWQSLS